jgi:hypothetical protein
MKPKYQKPTALPLGEAAKGSGVCNPGSALVGSTGDCIYGNNTGLNSNCLEGTGANIHCQLGYSTYWVCENGLNVAVQCIIGSNGSTGGS